MNQFVNAAVQMPDSVTKNGAATFSSSLDTHVDLFFRVGASRGKAAELIIRECVDQTWQPGIYHDTALSELIKHFGIEK